MTDKENKDLNINFGDLIKGLGRFIDIISDMVNSGITEKELKGEIKDPNIKNLHGAYGINIRIGADHKVLNDKFFSKNPPANKKIMEPNVEILEEENQTLIMVDLPGVEEDNIHYTIENDSIFINAQSENVIYKKKLTFKYKLTGCSISTNFNNNVFLIIINKAINSGDDSHEGK